MSWLLTSFISPTSLNEDPLGLLSHHLQVPKEAIKTLRVVRKSLDARRNHKPRWQYQVAFQSAEKIPARLQKYCTEWKAPQPENPPTQKLAEPIAIVGAGPAGLFAALELAERGYKVEVFEQGGEVKERARNIRRFTKLQEFYPHSNVLFGEGGAGTFSDGKLTSRTRNFYTQRALDHLVEAGAPADTSYLNKPHIGTDKLQFMVRSLRERAERAGVVFHWNSAVQSLHVVDGVVQGLHISATGSLPAMASESDPSSLRSSSAPSFEKFPTVVLAVGHSSRALYRNLIELGVALEAKPLAVGFRVEHPQELISQQQYGHSYGNNGLGAAEYYLTMQKEACAAYSFCMCPGGVIVPCADEEDGFCTNGMSYQARNGYFANAAVVIPVDSKDFMENYVAKTWDPKNLWAGVEFQQRLEKKAASLTDGPFCFPMQTLDAYLNGVPGAVPSKTSFQGRWAVTNMNKLFSDRVNDALHLALHDFERKIPGFISEGQALAPETRTSSPLRVVRDPLTLESVSTKGLFPLGEGAGYSGGIVSSAADGVRFAFTTQPKET